MVSIQKRKSRNYSYWGIVESVRINGKPRPILLEHLGTAEALLDRLRSSEPSKIKSYKHGDVAVMLDIAEEFQIVQTINRHIAKKQIRHGFTVGGALLLAAIGRICQPTSKDNWYEDWARYTSLSYLIGRSLCKIDSQFFWDQMNELSVDDILKIEEELINKIIEKENIDLDVLLCDTPNFFTYIGSCNTRNTIAKRGKNKQKRMDLKQFGLLLVTSREFQIPLLHNIYKGNKQEKTAFIENFHCMLDRFKSIAGTLENITLVFDQGNNPKSMLKDMEGKIKFIGAISPSQHQDLIEKANKLMTDLTLDKKENKLKCYYDRKAIWGIDLTYLVYISEKLRESQIRAAENNILELFDKLNDLKDKVKTPPKKGEKLTKQALEKKIKAMISKYKLDDIINYTVKRLAVDSFNIDFWIDEDEYEKIKNHKFGRRILITNRHDWSAKDVISAYWGKSQIENVFKNIKSPFHLSFNPQDHWTDHKIAVHGFICIIALFLFLVAYKKARDKAGYKGCPNSFLEDLARIRLAECIYKPVKKSKGRYKATYSLEDMDDKLYSLADAMGLIKDKFKCDIPFSKY